MLPLELYRKHRQALLNEPSGFVPDITEKLGFMLLRDNPSSLLVLYLHGAAGTLGSGYRPSSYRAIYGGAPDRIHVVAIDYRGFGTSTGSPSESGLLIDATALVDWAMQVAGIPADRIVIWGQSIGTAVASSLVQHMAMQPVPVLFAGLILVAPFTDVKTLTATYQVAGTIPLLGPLARFPWLLDYLNTFIRDKWLSKDRLSSFVRHCESLSGVFRKYHITIIHAEDDYDIPWSHSEQIFWHAVNASLPAGIRFEDLEKEKAISKVNLGAGGWVINRQTLKGVIREEISKHGLHDMIMGYPIISLAVAQAFGIE